MNILVGGIFQEANTFSGIKVSYEQFRRYYGNEVVEKLDECGLFQEADINIIPAAYAGIMPSAPLEKAEFQLFLDDFFSSYDHSVEIDGIYLCLHGAMYIHEVGSGELYFVEKLREKYGSEIPIFASFDFHGNMFEELAKQFNYVTAYKTAPHTDEAETRFRAVRAMICALQKKEIPRVKCIQIPMTFPGEMVITKEYPSNQILASLEAMVTEGLALEASWFCGFIWSDAKEIFMSVAVSAVDFTSVLEDRIEQEVRKIWELRYEFQYQILALPTLAAIEESFAQARKLKPVFLSDSGDNVTAGTAGDNAYMVQQLADYYEKNEERKGLRVLVTGIADIEAVKCCYKHQRGERFSLRFGGSLDKNSTKITGEVTLIRVGELKEDATAQPTKYAQIQYKNIDVLLHDRRCMYTEIKDFNRVGLAIADYDLICVKLGYLYPQLEEIAAASILAFSEGNAIQEVEKIPYQTKRKPFFPREAYPHIGYGKIPKPTMFAPKEPVSLTDKTMLQRKNKVLTQMRTKGIQALCVYADREHGGNFGYLTGFEPRFEEALLVLHESGKAYLLLGNESLRMGTYSRLENQVIHVPHFSLPNQPMKPKGTFLDLLKEAELFEGMQVGIVGWKMFTSPFEENEQIYEVPHFIVDGIQKVVGVCGKIQNGGSLFLDTKQGVRIHHNANEIAHYEYGATLASTCVMNVLEAVEVGKTELELGNYLSAHGQPITVQSICATGERFTNAEVAPRNKKVSLGDSFSVTMGLRGGLTSRVGYIAQNENDLPREVRDYVKKVAKPYYSAAVCWYETVGIGVTGGEMYRAIQETIPKATFGWSLNPGHLLSSEEWLTSPIYENSSIEIQSGMIFQMDIIPKRAGYAGANAEDGVAIADEELRHELSNNYKDVWERIQKRRKYIIEELGICLKEEILPLSNMVGYLRPYILERECGFFVKR